MCNGYAVREVRETIDKLEKRYADDHTANKDIRSSIFLYNKERLHLSIGMMTPEYVHQTGTVTKNLWKKAKINITINSKGNNKHKTVNAISP